MVSKLLLAVGETIERDGNERLREQYFAIREGIGAHKSPAEYGAFPFDAYSHTPTMAGAQQPGMTGQVKEDIISRWFELGVSVRDGQITFHPTMLRDADFVNGELRFHYCGTEIIYRKSPITNHQSPMTLSREDSAHLFARDGVIKQLIIEV
jgi:hypothetical protein